MMSQMTTVVVTTVVQTMSVGPTPAMVMTMPMLTTTTATMVLMMMALAIHRLSRMAMRALTVLTTLGPVLTMMRPRVGRHVDGKRQTKMGSPW